MKELAQLFLTFFKIGAITFGGGYAMLPFLQKELCSKRNWVTEEDLLNYFAIGQCTPGIIAVNTATFVGNSRKKTIGGIVATLGVIAPSIIIISIIALILQNIAELSIVQSAFKGIRVAVSVLIINAVIKLAKSSIVDIYGIIIFILSSVLSFIFGVSPLYIIASAAIGIIINKAGGMKKWPTYCFFGNFLK